MCVGVGRELAGEEGEAGGSGAELRDDGEQARQALRGVVGECGWE